MSILILKDGIFPAWRHNALGLSNVVHTPEECEALGDEWADSPAAFDEDTGSVYPDAETVGMAQEPAKSEPQVTASVTPVPTESNPRKPKAKPGRKPKVKV